jgi:CheY-like chemotaxis protein
MMVMILSAKGYLCDQCCNGSEAIKICQENELDHYDIIFMDNMMPVMV